MATSILVVKIRQPKLATKISKACLGKLFAELLEISGVKPWRCGEVDDFLVLHCDVIGTLLNLYGPIRSNYWWKHLSVDLFQQLVTHSLRLTDEGATTPKLVSGWDKYCNF